MGLPAGKAAEFVARAQTVLHVTGEQDPDFSLRAAAAMGIIADIGAAVACRQGNAAGRHDLTAGELHRR